MRVGNGGVSGGRGHPADLCPIGPGNSQPRRQRRVQLKIISTLQTECVANLALQRTAASGIPDLAGYAGDKPWFTQLSSTCSGNQFVWRSLCLPEQAQEYRGLQWNRRATFCYWVKPGVARAEMVGVSIPCCELSGGRFYSRVVEAIPKKYEPSPSLYVRQARLNIHASPTFGFSPSSLTTYRTLPWINQRPSFLTRAPSKT